MYNYLHSSSGIAAVPTQLLLSRTHTHKPRHKPGLPTGGEVHVHVPNIFLAWKVTLSIFYLILVLTTSNQAEHASSNISTCSKRQLPYLETCENPSSSWGKAQACGWLKRKFFFPCLWIKDSLQCPVLTDQPSNVGNNHCSVCVQALNTSG